MSTDKTPAQAADPLNNEQWPALKADIEKAAKDWATHPNGGPMDEDLYFQFIRVMAYVVESTNILHRSPRFAGQSAQAPSPSLTVDQIMKVVKYDTTPYILEKTWPNELPELWQRIHDRLTDLLDQTPSPR